MAKARKSPAPRHGLALTADQAEVLTEMAALVWYSDGFTYTKPMMAVLKSIAGRLPPADRRACLRRAGARELVR